MFWAPQGKSHTITNSDGEIRHDPYPGSNLNDDELGFMNEIKHVAARGPSTVAGKNRILRLIQLMTATRREHRPVAGTVWCFLPFRLTLDNAMETAVFFLYRRTLIGQVRN